MTSVCMRMHLSVVKKKPHGNLMIKITDEDMLVEYGDESLEFEVHIGQRQ